MTKVHRTIRLEADVSEAADAWAAECGLSKSEAIERLIRAGLDAAGPKDHSAQTDGTTGSTEGEAARLRAIVDLLTEHNRDLRQTVSTLTAQLAVKDGQIARAHDLADHAQQLHAAEVTKALPSAHRPSLIERILGKRAGANDG